MVRAYKPERHHKSKRSSVAISTNHLQQLHRIARYYAIRKSIYISVRQVIDGLVHQKFKQLEDEIKRTERAIAGKLPGDSDD